MLRRAVLVGLLLTTLASAQAPLPLTFDDAARLALAKNPKIRAGLAVIVQASEQAEVVASPARPQITLGLTRDTQQTTLGPPFQTNFLTGVPVSIQADPVSYSTGRGVLELRQLLFDGGLVAARIQQAKHSARSSRHSLTAIAHQLVLDVQLSALDVLEATTRHKTYLKTLEQARYNEALAQARYDAGTAAQADILFARVPVSRAELDLSVAEQRIRVAQATLNRVLGVPQDTVVDLVAPDPAPSALDSPADAVRRALFQRPELLAQREEVQAAEEAYKAACRESNPRLSAVGQVQAVGYNRELGLVSPGWKVGMEVAWPLSEGNRAAHLAAAAEARIAEQVARLEDLELAVELEVRRASEELAGNERSEKAARTQWDRARAALEIAQGQYEAGVGTFVQVNQAQLELIQAEQALVEVVYARQRARSRLAYARGDTPLVLK